MRRSPTIVAALLSCTSASAVHAQASAPSTRQLTVDLSDEYRPATHVASGALYGLGTDGEPDAKLLRDINPLMFTQMAPGGTQVPVGDALRVAPMAAAAGARVTIRLPDIYPNFPYKWIGWDDWNGKVDSVVDATMASGATIIYAYELWNEPNWTWDYAAAGSFLDGWKKTFLRVRAKDPDRPIMGPSIDRFDHAYLRNFLSFAKANGVIPDIVSWHELGGPEGSWQDTTNVPYIAAHITEYRAIEASLGITPLPISINEFGVTNEEGVPGSMVRYFAQFERGGVESANMAFWFTPGKLSNIITDDARPNGGWWLFRWYGQMGGRMAMTTPAHPEFGFDGIASIDPGGRRARVLFGGADGDNLIVVKGIGPALGQRVHVTVEAAPWHGPDIAVAAPTPVFEGDFAVKEGRIVVPITAMDRSFGYQMIVSPTGGAITRYEAEAAQADDASATAAATASNGRYLAKFGGTGTSARFAVNVAGAGRYELAVRYANAAEAPARQTLGVNGQGASPVDYPMTGGDLAIERTDIKRIPVVLKKGANTLTLTGVAGAIDLDFIQLTPAPAAVRIEAERATFGSALIEPSSYASSQYFIAPNTVTDSFVEFRPELPAAGTYMMDIGYSSMAKTGGGHSLTVNGGAAETLAYGSTGGRFRAVPTNYPGRIRSVPVALNEGRNVVRLDYRGGGYVEVDYIELRPGVTRYEAEGATLAGANPDSSATASGGRFAAGVKGQALTARFDMTAAAPGKYRLRIAYGNGAKKPVTGLLAIAGAAPKPIKFAPGGLLDTYGALTREVDVTFRKGVNKVTVTTGPGEALQLDCIDVVRL